MQAPGSRLSREGVRFREGRWTIKAAIDEGVPAHVLSSALYERFSSRGDADFADKLLSAMRYEFGGHLEKPAKPSRLPTYTDRPWLAASGRIGSSPG